MEELSDELPLDMEMQLREDIGAELDYFILLTLLGIENEAQEFASNVLWPHLRHFPVFAEIANYFVIRDNIKALRKLLDHIERFNIQFDDPEERQFLTYLRLIEVDQDIVATTWYQGAADLIEEFDGWASETSCLILEVQMHVATRSLDASLSAFVMSLTDYCQQLQHREMFEQAARIFWIACSASVRMFTYYRSKYSVRVIDQLWSCLQEDFGRAHPHNASTEADNWTVYAMLNKVALLAILWTVIDTASEDLPIDHSEELLNTTRRLVEEIEAPLQEVFEGLPDTKPRGSCVTFYRGLCAELEEMDSATPVAEDVAAATPALTDMDTATDDETRTEFSSSTHKSLQTELKWSPRDVEEKLSSQKKLRDQSQFSPYSERARRVSEHY